ncbi:fimbria/pilus chaperone family protein [Leclercia adecarboxylata]|uniref:fimbria/pilus chaperone family protein n=1 Tax=Leclercia adecarboxylata TaxID=83655 RepID=UPI002DB749CA|nr:fimbria/pilus chaperone family protein [Leclercia adecarboxylata]MEB6380715.1 fimbria/pilus chaperone family protein [Leclercia adecarboxylata]
MKHSVIYSLLFLSMQACATGMVPETSVLLVNAEKGEASMNITNTDSAPALLYTNIVDLPESNKNVRLIVSQPVVRVEPGAVQRIRFMLQMDKPLTQQELKRVTFEGIPPKIKGKERLAVTIRQDLPVIIHPAGLKEDATPWKHLQWIKSGDAIVVKNPSDYVVRMTTGFTSLPSGQQGSLKNTYLLPHTSMTVTLPDKADTKVEFYPASRYGYKGERYTASLQ